jgi:hypothetical protein
MQANQLTGNAYDWDEEYVQEFAQTRFSSDNEEVPRHAVVVAVGDLIGNLKTSAGNAVPSVPNSAAMNSQPPNAISPDASAVNDDDLSDEPIPFPFGGKVAHFPAFASRGPLFRIGFASNAQPLASGGFVPIKHQGVRKIEFSGQRLTMHDKGVWEAVVDMAKPRKQGIGGTHQIGLAEIARRVGKKDDGGTTMNWIFDRLTRLANGKLRIARDDGTFHTGSLIHSLVRDKGNVSIRFDRELMLIAFGQELQFRHNAARRSLLGTSLAKWLHDFYSSHTKPIDIDLQYIRERCGYAGHVKDFPQRLISAMDDIKARAPELIKDFKIDSHRKQSDFWKLSVEKGEEKPSFDEPNDDSAKHENAMPASMPTKHGKQRPPRSRWAQY